MSKFSIEVVLDDDISVELFCNKCGNKFTSELDLHFKGQEFSSQSEGVLYCLYCEEPYEYTIRFDNNNLDVKFKNNELNGVLKVTEKTNLEDYVGLTPHKSRRFYFLQIERLEKIINLKAEEYIINQTLYRLIYSGVITALETYLSEIFTQLVFHSEYTLEKFVSEYEPFKKEKISLHEIFKKYNNIELRVNDELDNFIYHNISKLINIFNIFNFNLNNFSKIKNIANYIQKRHNIIHKSGLGKDASLHEINEEEIITLINDINLFVEYIAEQFKNECFLPYNDKDDDLPF